MDDKLFKYLNMPVTLPPNAPKRGKFKGSSGNVVTLNLYPIKWLGDNINRTTYTLRRWESLGWIPKSVFRLNNIRYFTKSQIQLLLFLSIKHDIRNHEQIGRPMPQEFIDESHELMKELLKFILAGAVEQDLAVNTKSVGQKHAK